MLKECLYEGLRRTGGDGGPWGSYTTTATAATKTIFKKQWPYNSQFRQQRSSWADRKWALYFHQMKGCSRIFPRSLMLTWTLSFELCLKETTEPTGEWQKGEWGSPLLAGQTPGVFVSLRLKRRRPPPLGACVVIPECGAWSYETSRAEEGS